MALVPGATSAGSANWAATAVPAQQGVDTDAGYTATVIARWDCVPRQDIADGFRPSLVAFHIAGIQYVKFYANNGAASTVTQMALNDQTGEIEYFADLDLTGVADGTLIEVRAEIVPNAGYPIVLQGDDFPLGAAKSVDETQSSMFLWANAGGTMQSGARYVDARATIAGSWSGTPTATEKLTQATTGATCFFLSGTNPITVSYVAGTPDDSNGWVGQRSAATFTPTATPVFIGDDSNAGTAADSPKRTIASAVAALNTANSSTTAGCEGCSIYLRGHVGWAATQQGTAKRWLQIAPWPGDAATEAAIRGPSAAGVAPLFLKLNGIQLHQDVTGAVAGGNACLRHASTNYGNRYWINDCVASGIGNLGTEAQVSQNEIIRSSDAAATMKCFWTGGAYSDHCALAFPSGCTLTRGVSLSNLGADIWNYAALVIGNTIAGMNHTDTDIHADVYQIVSAVDNVIFYNNTVTNQASGQGLALGSVSTTAARVAIVQNLIHTTTDTQPVYVPVGTAVDHVLVWHNYIRHTLRQFDTAPSVPTNLSIAGNVFLDTAANLSTLTGEIDGNHSIGGTYTANGTDWTTGDAGFTDAAALDFTPTESSVLVGRLAPKTPYGLDQELRANPTAIGPYPAAAEYEVDPEPDTTPPAAPTSLSATARAGAVVRVSFTKAADSDLDYTEIGYTIDGGEEQYAQVAKDAANQYVDVNATHGQVVVARGRSVDTAENESAWTSTVTATADGVAPTFIGADILDNGKVRVYLSEPYKIIRGTAAELGFVFGIDADVVPTLIEAVEDTSYVDLTPPDPITGMTQRVQYADQVAGLTDAAGNLVQDNGTIDALTPAAKGSPFGFGFSYKN